MSTCSRTALFSASSSDEEAWRLSAEPSAGTAVREALSPVSAASPAGMLFLPDALRDISTDRRTLTEALPLFSVSDSEAAVDADADLLSLAAALALSLELALWLTLRLAF